MDTQLFAPLQSFLVAGPERLAAEIVLGAIALILLSIYVRGPIGTLFRVAVFIGAMAVIIGGTAILMNNVSLAGPPNPAVRLHRFLTMDWAATSDKGDGAAACADPAATRRPPAARTPSITNDVICGAPPRTWIPHPPRPRRPSRAVSVAARRSPVIPSWCGISYPGIPPARLMQVVRLHGEWTAGMRDRELGPGQALHQCGVPYAPA